MKIAGGSLSPALEKQAVKLAAWLPFGVAEELLEELSGVNLSDSTIWHLTQACGEQLEQNSHKQVKLAFEATVALSLPPPVAPVPVKQLKWGQRGVGMDGVMIHIRGEGYKETKLGCLFEVEAALPKAEVEGSQNRVEATAQSYCFYLGGPEEFGKRLWLEASAREWELALRQEVLGDGAVWVWKVAAGHFGEAVEVVDWY